MYLLRKIMPLYLVIIFISFARGQECSIPCYEDSIKQYYQQILSTRSDLVKKGYNEKIIKIFRDILEKPESFTYPFDSLKHFGKLYPADKLFRIYNWGINYEDGTWEYSGFIQCSPMDGRQISVYPLQDKSSEISSPEKSVLSNLTWYGALYYKMIENIYRNNKTYTLLAYDGNNLLSDKKIIDVLTFDKEGKPIFGSPIFTSGKNVYHRVIFEYSSRVVMTLRYQEKANMIVNDHLSPEKPQYAGQFMFYGPDFSYDGWKFKNGIWEQVMDIDVRNPKE